ncbi:hypothetical protein KUTeg_008442 [Tegillarca granosa]|uniref:Macro domain-containing protein n=1 Tax=Tegillarca granosa TaxID=220873 RepID=A0ABQ9F955_TEGGR|nr:hypothetical protein KUTeg_008442 [Tegillarca granosa]
MTDTDMFLRVLELNTTTGGSLVRTIISNTYNKLGYASLTDFLNDDAVKHQMFHLWQKKCCCNERSAKREFTRAQWLKMYRIDSSKCAAITHPPAGDCFCQYASPATVQLDIIIDVSVGETFMSSIDCLKREVSVDVLEALGTMKKIRNRICHKTKMELDLRKFNETWTELTRCLVKLGEFINEETKKKVQYDIGCLQDKTYDAKDKIITILLENMFDALSVEENNTKLSGIEDALFKQKDMMDEILKRLPPTQNTTTDNEQENGPMTIKIIQGDITQQEVDVIVNTTSEDLKLSRGGVSRHILKQGGQVIQDQLNNYCQGSVDSGMVVKTDGGNLPCSYIYHGWLPRWGETDECKKKLSSFIGESLYIAGIDKMTSVALPAVGAGILGYPGDLVAREIFDTVAYYFMVHPTSSLKEVRAFETEESRRNDMFQRS